MSKETDEQYTEEEVLEFINQNKSKDNNNKSEIITVKVNKDEAKLLATEVKEEEIVDAKYELNISNSSLFNTADSISIIDISVSDEEKEIWLKSILLDTESILDVNLCGSNLNYKIKALNIEEDNLLVDIVTNKDKFGFKKYDSLDLARKLCIATCLISENNNKFFKDSLISRFKSKVNKLKQRVKYLDSLSMDKYKLLINVFKIFDRKQFILTNSIANNSFWKPLS